MGRSFFCVRGSSTKSNSIIDPAFAFKLSETSRLEATIEKIDYYSIYSWVVGLGTINCNGTNRDPVLCVSVIILSWVARCSLSVLRPL
jgi:hypothetical protein